MEEVYLTALGIKFFQILNPKHGYTVNLLEQKMKKKNPNDQRKHEKAITDIDSLSEIIFAKKFIYDCDRKKYCEEKWTTLAEKCVELLNDFCEKNILAVNLMKVTDFILLLARNISSC